MAISRFHHRREIALTGFVLALASAPVSARAQSRIPADDVIALACGGRVGQTISQALLGEALLTKASKPHFEWSGLGPNATRSEELGAIVTRLGRLRARNAADRLKEPSEDGDLLEDGIRNLEERLTRAPADDDVFAFSGKPENPERFLFEPGSSWQLQCKPPKDPVTPFPTTVESEFKPPFEWALRAKPEELALIGKERKAAGAATISADRTNTMLDNGSIKKVTNFKIDATLGVRITGSDTTNKVYLYDRYNLSQSRTRPLPKLDPGAKESDGDTNALETGFLTNVQLTKNDVTLPVVGKLFLTAKAATVFDFAKDGARLKGEMLLRPAMTGDIGICALGHYGSFLGLPTRCRIQFDLEAGRVLRRGSIEKGDFDNYVALGVRPSFDLYVPTGNETELLGSLNYRFLPVIRGEQDHIERLDIAVKYRFWTTVHAGIDLGFAYSKGRNELSYEKEDILSLGVGIIY